MTRLLIRDLVQLATPAGAHAPLRRGELGDVEVIENAFLIARDGRIEAVEPCVTSRRSPATSRMSTDAGSAPSRVSSTATRIRRSWGPCARVRASCGGGVVRGLLAAGGGILSTMRATRAAGGAALVEAVVRHRDAMLAHGTTTFEGKSGYGLDHDTELAQLEAVRAADGVPTWLGAHAVPPEHTGADEYVDWLIEDVLPDAARIATAADVFVERETFGVDQARRYLVACRAAGLDLRIHGDQLTEIGAVPLAVELGARSIDHLEATGQAGVAQLAASDVVAVLLPVAALYLARPMPPARALADAGAAIALATDFNPGSAYCESLPVVCTLACTQLGLTPEEALVACTVNAAYVLGLDRNRGRLAAGQRADVVLLDAPDWRHLAYHLAGNVVHTVVQEGRIAFLRA